MLWRREKYLALPGMGPQFLRCPACSFMSILATSFQIIQYTDIYKLFNYSNIQRNWEVTRRSSIS
jgi:hypothetical protein